MFLLHQQTSLYLDKDYIEIGCRMTLFRKKELLRGLPEPIFLMGIVFLNRQQAENCLLESNEINAKIVKQQSRNAKYLSYKCVNESCSYQAVASSTNNGLFICRKLKLHNCILGDYGEQK